MQKTSQRNKILELLSDYLPHCLTKEMYIRDDRARISELRKLGYNFDESIGNCRNPLHNHLAPLKLRRLTNNPLNSPLPVHQKYCCGPILRGEDIHSKDCKVFQSVERKINVLF